MMVLFLASAFEGAEESGLERLNRPVQLLKTRNFTRFGLNHVQWDVHT